jgi:hypothetical protein
MEGNLLTVMVDLLAGTNDGEIFLLLAVMDFVKSSKYLQHESLGGSVLLSPSDVFRRLSKPSKFPLDEIASIYDPKHLCSDASSPENSYRKDRSSLNSHLVERGRPFTSNAVFR